MSQHFLPSFYPKFIVRSCNCTGGLIPERSAEFQFSPFGETGAEMYS
jgi:hypothetical protein